VTASHPLDPLTAAEIGRASDLIRSTAGTTFGPRTRFVTIEQAAPAKEAVLTWARGGPLPPRDAFAVLLDRDAGNGNGVTYEVIVSLTDSRVISCEPAAGVQPLADVTELAEAEELLRLDPAFQHALARRGVTDFTTVQVDAWPAGNFGSSDDPERRLARGLAFIRPHGEDNEWAHPVDGVIGLVDLNRLEVLGVEDHGVVPIPPETGDFGNDPDIRRDLKPLEITQRDGPSFTLEGRVLEWQRWHIHVGFTPREGLVLNQIGYRDEGRLRPILYRASLSEMVVPYGDPSPTHFFKNAFDAGENGVGIATVPLELGCDCLGEIRYIDAAICDAKGEPVELKNAICIHEEDVGVLWRHVQWRTGQGTVRRSRRLVISSFVAIGNYDYGFFWYFYQDGSIEFEVKLTGVLSTGAVEPGTRPEHGILIAPQLNAMLHQHYFNMRLDFDVDGQRNTVEEVWTESVPPGPGNPHGNAFRVRRRALESELAARRCVDTGSARYWEIINPSARHRLGDPVGYRLVPGENTVPFAQPDAAVRKRAGFIGHHLAVTPYRAGERYAAGDYPNQHPGGAGLPEWMAADRPVVDEDIVVWYTFGHHHVPRPEDWPVMPVATIGFKLKPVGFFERNPSLDVPPPTPAHGAACLSPPAELTE
jgi:primary-amine oxidase